jgi:hypothetical protein
MARQIPQGARGDAERGHATTMASTVSLDTPMFWAIIFTGIVGRHLWPGPQFVPAVRAMMIHAR